MSSDEDEMEEVGDDKLLFLASTTYDVHRSIKNNQTPPSEEQLKGLEDYIKSVRRSP
ncbi:hypothetical protein E2542_SST21094 [Spatholobus suberectus]|nr:hypothetical protein E2542_SST21094 [Spatholobus suberectus]